ncbi:YjiH family protein [Paenibacillus sp. 1001270B_150601_E10]|uniref:YjiH family protein n=1 Tax=Paenibacillus sp. 1001270B_150601_E10 TaxID=2787079 RepID=UPI0018A0849E|nr:YjiH family protein [Paenibacillus sp. 1001270B_150601_E10]
MTSKNTTPDSTPTRPESLSVRGVLSFLIPSIIGLFLFVVPITWQGEMTVPIALLAKIIQGALENVLPIAALLIIGIAWIGSTIALFVKPASFRDSHLWRALFQVTPFWYAVRTIGLIFVLCTYFKLGPEWVWSQDTGGMLLTSLLPGLFVVFLLAGLLLPLLVDFGLLEFAGMLMTKIMRPLFTLPGQSAINCIASWLGDGTIGVMMTSKQYEQGYYTKREAAVIGTTFTAVSITFCFIVLSNVQLGHLFLPFYATVTFAGLVAAIIMPRIPPLSWKPDMYEEGIMIRSEEVVPEGWSTWRYGMHQAVSKAKSHEGITLFVRNGLKNTLDLWIGVIPVVMSIGTAAVAVATHTPIFEWIGKPFYPILAGLGVPEAQAASETIMVGFADMFLPTVLASGIESEMTRFIVAALSVTQLIYMSEVGGLLLGSKLPITMKDLILIFLLRTVITLPIIIGIAHFIF